MPSASILIPVLDRLDALQRLLNQLNSQHRTDFEVVVIDDGSTEPVRFVPNTFRFALRVLRHDRRYGVGKARNTGVHAAQSQLIVFVDSDAEIESPDWFETHLSLHDRAKSLAKGGGKDLYVLHSAVRGVSDTLCGRVDTYSNWFGSCMRRPMEIRGHHVPMNNTSMCRAVFERVGLFDEELRVCEDVEWSFRCLDNGVALVFVPGAPLSHRDRETPGEVWRHYRQFGRYAPLVRAKRPNAPHSWLYPRGPLSATLLFLPLTTLMTLYIIVRWLSRDPRVLLYAPGLYLANVAYYAGLCETVLAGAGNADTPTKN